MFKIQKILWFARRFNTLIPLGITIVISSFTLYGIITIITTPDKPKTTIASTPNIEKIEEDGTIFDLDRETGFRSGSEKANDLFILKLVAKRKSGRGYENGFRYGTRNFLHINERTGEGRWLFPTQNQIINSQTLQIDDKGHVLGLVVNVQSFENDNDSANSKNLPITVYFVSVDLKEKVVVLDKVEELFTVKKIGNDWSVVYKKDMQVHHALYSFTSKKVLSDKVVANLEEVK